MEDTPTVGRTRWRRFAVAAVPSLAAAGALVVLMANGAIAASFAVSGQQFKVSGDSLDGTGFVQFGGIDASVGAAGAKVPHPVVVSGIAHATIHNLCQSVVTPIPLLGDFTLQIHAGAAADKPVTADNLVIDVTQLSGDATFTNIEIGRDAFTLNKGPSGVTGAQNTFGQQADTVHINSFQQSALSTNAGTFTLPGLHLSLVSGRHECF
ncbi:MAG TPA: DUF6230 family protein [Mycobacteriales bacterium]|nr:DUF6230 family protein [Mycobacteriales bacterium]